MACAPDESRAGRCLERIETHRSWVFLTESRAYKVRKLRANGQLSAADVDSRRRASEQELALYLRLARSVYLGVVPCIARRSVRASEIDELRLWSELPSRSGTWTIRRKQLTGAAARTTTCSSPRARRGGIGAQ